MSEFKSGILLQTRNVLSPKGIESYSSLLRKENPLISRLLIRVVM